jgi:hypothetical protein
MALIAIPLAAMILALACLLSLLPHPVQKRMGVSQKIFDGIHRQEHLEGI